jgi:hypothetical protein
MNGLAMMNKNLEFRFSRSLVENQGFSRKRGRFSWSLVEGLVETFLKIVNACFLSSYSSYNRFSSIVEGRIGVPSKMTKKGGYIGRSSTYLLNLLERVEKVIKQARQSMALMLTEIAIDHCTGSPRLSSREIARLSRFATSLMGMKNAK